MNQASVYIHEDWLLIKQTRAKLPILNVKNMQKKKLTVIRPQPFPGIECTIQLLCYQTLCRTLWLLEPDCYHFHPFFLTLLEKCLEKIDDIDRWLATFQHCTVRFSLILPSLLFPPPDDLPHIDISRILFQTSHIPSYFWPPHSPQCCHAA